MRRARGRGNAQPGTWCCHCGGHAECPGLLSSTHCRLYFRIVLHQNHTGCQSGRDEAYGRKMNALEMANIGNTVRQKINKSLKEDGGG